MRAVADLMAVFSDKVSDLMGEVGAAAPLKAHALLPASPQVAAQAEVVDLIHAQTGQVLDDVDAGHAELVKAAKARRAARHVYVAVTLALAAVLLFLDFVFD